jgi:hypothetical protein
VRWTVENDIGAAGLPVEAWAAAAQVRLNSDPAVICAEIVASRDEDGVDGVQTADLSVNVSLESADSVSAAALVQQHVVDALWEVIGDQEAGWMSGPWVATPETRPPSSHRGEGNTDRMSSSSVAMVRWTPPYWGLPGDDLGVGDDRFVVSVDWEERDEFVDLDAALAEASRYSPKLRVVIDGLGEWQGPVSDLDRASIDAYVTAGRARFAAEQRRYDEPVEWFVAFMDPDAEDLSDAAHLVVGAAGVNSARIHRRVRRGRSETWLVLRVRSRDLETARSLASDAVLRVLWPPERPRTGETMWMTHTGHTEAGLADYEDDALN